MSHCRDCCNGARRSRYNANLGHERRRSRDYYTNNRESVLERRSSQENRQRYLDWKARNPDGLWAQWLKKTHGMEPAQWWAMWEEQDGKCYICDIPLPEDRSNVSIDHDHSCCGDRNSCRYCRRGLTHQRCNTWIGMLGEDIALMRRALDNFERARAQTQALIMSKPEQPELPLRLVSGDE
jgi:hypothetical protein